MQFIHIIITIGFRRNRCSGNREIFSISFYHGSMRQTLILFKTIPINQQMLGTNFQLIHSTMPVSYTHLRPAIISQTSKTISGAPARHAPPFVL